MRFIDLLWYSRPGWGVLLAPFGLLWGLGVRSRRLAYRSGLLASRRFPVPVVVVGNLTIGGTGKTPLTIWLAIWLRSQGYRPAVACSGYGGRARHWPQQVRSDSDPIMVGDEAVLVARHTGCPVGAGRDRLAVVSALLEHEDCDVILCDDGLQHLALARDVEIAVIDGGRRHGNGLCLPAGPLREPVGRLRSVDFVVTNGVPRAGEIAMELRPGEPRRVGDERIRCSVEELRRRPVHAVCGIGNPARFFEQLRNLGFSVHPHPFPDHHRFIREDLAFADDLPVVMTEKDAVKCRDFAGPQTWYIPVRAAPQATLGAGILTRLRALRPVGIAAAQARA